MKRTKLTPAAIKALRLRLGETQKAFADRLGVSFASVNRWERGHTVPQGAAALALRRLGGPVLTVVSELVGRDFGYGPLDLSAATYHGTWHPASGHPGGWRVVRGLSPMQELQSKTGRRILFKTQKRAAQRAAALNAVESKG